MSKIRVILISSVRPAPTSAGHIVLHRHLVDQSDIDLEVYGTEPTLLSPGSLARLLLGKLGQTGFGRWAEDACVLWGGRWVDAALPTAVAEPERTVVVTVAHGDGFMAAQRFARRHGLPLVSFFQDWWPDIAAVHGFAKRRLEKEFRELAAESATAICVSEGMKRALVSPNCVVLPALPSPRNLEKTAPTEPAANRKFKLLYFGSLGEYGPMLGEALTALDGNEHVELIVRGTRPDWPREFAKRMRKQGKWLEFAPRDELEAWLGGADAFLVPMVFDAKMRKRMETSFPSKLVEFAQFGKPLVVWGPDYCSAVEWGRRDNRALCVTDPNPPALAAALEQLASSALEREHYACAASQAASSEFCPAKIQAEFVGLLESAL